MGVAACACLATACASSGAVPRPFPDVARRAPNSVAPPSEPPPGPLEHPPASGAIVTTALALRGVPYRNGGADLNGFDCSGFTQYVFVQHGIPLPRDVRRQFASGVAVASNELALGDLVFFETTARGPSHVGIVIGGDQFVHAPSSTGVVRVERISASYWAKRYVGARRMVASQAALN